MTAICQPAIDIRANQLLATLPQADVEHWLDHLEPVNLALHQVLYTVAKAPEYVYFPTTAIVSMMYVTLEGSTAEVAVVGNDGVVGISLLLGADVTATEAFVQSAGQTLRVSARFVKDEIERSSHVMKLVLLYTQTVLGQMAQTAVCNRYHSIGQQLCRRILLGLDRLACDELDMTHELAANLLGVRREGVTAAANKLQEAGLIRYHRGHIVILDRERLEQKTCECYAVAKKEYNRLLAVAKV